MKIILSFMTILSLPLIILKNLNITSKTKPIITNYLLSAYGNARTKL